MRWLLSLVLLTILGIVQSLSSTGSKLLVVLEEAADQGKYSKLWADLQGEFDPSLSSLVASLGLTKPAFNRAGLHHLLRVSEE